MRFITNHQINPANDRITIAVVDEPGAGGANHEYVVEIDGKVRLGLNFQNGPIAEAGVNGLTHEALLAIVADRLECFQRGPYACDENAKALAAINEAQQILQSRTQRRMAAGIEGTSALDTAAPPAGEQELSDEAETAHAETNGDTPATTTDTAQEG